MTDNAATAADAPAGIRKPTPVDDLAEEFLSRQAELDPLMATYIGLSGHDTELPDLSPDGLQALDALAARTLSAVADQIPADDVDRVTIRALTERLVLQRELHAAGTDLSDLKNIASPVQGVRNVFDLMPTSAPQDWADIAARLGAIPDAMDGYIASLRLAASRGDVAPQRQVKACVTQCRDNLGPTGFFVEFVRGAGGSVADASAGTAQLPPSLEADLVRGSEAAQSGYRKLADFLAEELMPLAVDSDPVGRDKYQLFSREFLGATVDLEETYSWGIEELARIDQLMSDTANRIKRGASVPAAIAQLDADPARKLAGTAALQAWMQDTSDQAVQALADTHFDIPGPIRTLECRIAPTHTGSIYYTGPSEDFSRPGRMWWSVPEGVTEFTTWRELTTVYHEGVPGHHLQVAQTAYRRNLLNSWRRLASWTSGHGEGWALYAEWLMADLGFLDDPGDFLGMLDGQSLRAARVVIDIGVHCGFQAPSEVGGGAWTYDKAWRMLSTHSTIAEPILRFELDRYLGWPGQAPAYKIGERHWLQLREEMKAREGDTFDLKSFHRRALDVGGVGLDVLRAAVLGEL
ncbi:MAG: hypothetical protein QOH56_930 [Pseudonocardiales bacterium]|jgi:uncharacterized protein (DUF885 family)|nr:hypothetical protein [Pseudonocardiales bacterium]